MINTFEILKSEAKLVIVNTAVNAGVALFLESDRSDFIFWLSHIKYEESLLDYVVF